MPHKHSCLFVHVVFSTKDRAPDVSPELARRLHPYMAGIVRELDCVPVIINGPSDHVHVLVSMPTKISVSDFVRVLKTNSSRWVNEQCQQPNRFGWQTGYGAFTVSGSKSDDVRRYIASQQERHQRMSFQEEFLALLRKHRLECDAGDVFD